MGLKPDDGITPATGVESAGEPTVTTTGPGTTDPGPSEPTPTAEEIAAAEEQERIEQKAAEGKPWFQKRMNEITRQKYDQERRAETAEARSAELEQRITTLEGTQPAQEIAPTRPEPTPEDHEHDQVAYIKDLTAWNAEQIDAKRTAQDTVNQENVRRKATAEAWEEKRVKMVNAGKEKYKDFETVVFGIPPGILTPDMASDMLEAGTSPDLAYYLGQNLEEASRISLLPPGRRAYELGALDTKLANAKTDTTKAPAPTNVGTGTDSGPVDYEKLAKDDPSAWVKARNEGKI